MFLLLYATWCGHCKALLPKWDALALQFAADKTVTIAKMDVNLHDAPTLYKVLKLPFLLSRTFSNLC